jgi:hypothetical protein
MSSAGQEAETFPAAASFIPSQRTKTGFGINPKDLSFAFAKDTLVFIVE